MENHIIDLLENGQPVIGTHFWPLRVFSVNHAIFPREDLFEIIVRLNVADLELVITRGSAVMVARPNGPEPALEPVKDYAWRKNFQERFCSASNLLFAEMSMRGLVSEPLTNASIGTGAMTETHGAIVGVAGGRETYGERTIEAFGKHNRAGTTGILGAFGPAILQDGRELKRAKALADMSPTLPNFVAHAYYSFSRQYMESSILNGWIVIEQIIDYEWNNFKRQSNPARKKRMDDNRTYSAAVRLDTLALAGQLPHDLCEEAHVARRARNDLAHRGAGGSADAQQVMSTMRTFVARAVGDDTVAAPNSNEVLGW